MTEKKYVFFFLGGPGAGKGTQCEKLVEKYPMSHFSTGDLLREEMVRPESEYGKLIKGLIDEGKLVPGRITTQLLLNAIRDSPNRVFLVDGFPRNHENQTTFDELADPNIFEVVKCVTLDVCRETMLKRILKRAEYSGRSDDNEVAFNKRYQTFLDLTIPMIDFYGNKNQLLRIDGEGSIDEVFTLVEKEFVDFLKEKNIPF